MAFNTGYMPRTGMIGFSPTIYFNPLLGRGQNLTGAQRPPQTSLFVGNISDKCTNEFIQQILEECGKVSNWKRIKGSNGKFQAFGFCDFDEPDGTLRALRVLHDFQIGDKKLNLRADDKVRSKLVEEWNKKQILSGKPPFSSTLGLKELPHDEEALKIDEEVRLKVLNMIEKDHPELLIVEDGELSDKEKDKKSKDDRRKNDDRKDRARRHSRSRSVSRSRSPRRRRSRTPRNKKRRQSSSSDSDSRSRSGSRSSRSSSRSTNYDKKRRSRSRSADTQDSEDAREKKQLKKQLKEKEMAYVNRLKKWEVRERRMARSYEKEESKEQQRRRDVQKEAKKLRHFLEDYDDEKDDVKYYKSSSLFQRRRDYEKEKEQDALDRKKEIQEIEDLKKQIIAEGKEAMDAEEEAKKRHRIQEEAALRKLREDSGSPNPHKPAGNKEGESSEESESGSSGSESEGEDGDKKVKIEPEGGWTSTPNNDTGTPKEDTKDNSSKWKTAITIPSGATATVPSSSNNGRASPNGKPSPRPDLSQRLNGVFGMDDEEEEEPVRKKLKPFEITNEDRMQVLTPEERKKKAKELIDKIPTAKDALFAFNIDWAFVDAKLIETRVRPWVTSKIQHYIGEDERSLVEFVCEKIQAHVQPDRLLQDMRLILDDEAETFVVKMWRLIIYESESRRMGLGPIEKKQL
ncbi:unnamed protein product, partial [Mesorhabditis belari]|uniref:RNA-binding protein 25 n=1 Tax=Mesorhabditis belari TaxID=2138241 RepID=A0AAF3EG63_9BILA